MHCALKGRRTGNFEDYKNLIKLGQYFNAIHFFGNQALAPNDLAVNTRHLDTVLVNLTLSDKIFLTWVINFPTQVEVRTEPENPLGNFSDLG